MARNGGMIQAGCGGTMGAGDFIPPLPKCEVSRLPEKFKIMAPEKLKRLNGIQPHKQQVVSAVVDYWNKVDSTAQKRPSFQRLVEAFRATA